VDSTNNKIKEHDEAKEKRLKDQLDSKIIRDMNRRLKFDQYCQIIIVKTRAALLRMKKNIGDKKILVEALRNQIRVRRHVYGISQKDLPNIKVSSNVNVDAECTRLVKEMEVLVQQDLPNMIDPPQPYPSRQPAPAPSSAAQHAYDDYTELVKQAYDELTRLTNENMTFVTQTTCRLTAAANPTASEDDRAELNGTRFVEEGILWRVLDVDYSEQEEEIVVWYYDVDKADEDDVSEEDMHMAREATPMVDLDCLERSSMDEVRAWIEESNGHIE
jgi:hypothetical protein